jgi:cytochrome c oxidase subunit I+III
MFLTSINLQIKTLFMATTIGISLPFDLMVFALIYTLLKGRVRFTTPFLFSFGALVLFIVGGITGVFLGAVVLDYEFRGTYWVVAHFHYVMVGGVTALIGGLYYWYPKITGRMYDEFLGKVHFAVYFVGFNLLYFPMFVAWETPRRVFEYEAGMTLWHRAATVGAVVLALSFVVMFYNLVTSAWAGSEAEDNPWRFSTTAEWAVPSPPPLENFPGVPTYGDGALSFREERSATDGGAMVASEREASHDDASHASVWPFALGVAAFVLFFGLSGLQGGSFPEGATGGVYAGATGVGLLFGLASLVGMARERFDGPTGPFGESWPFEGVENGKVGMWVFLASDVVLFGAFIGAYVFVRYAAGWGGWEPIPENVRPGLVNTYILLTSSFAVVLALEAAERESRWGVVASLVTTLALGVAFLGNKAIEWLHLFGQGVVPSEGVRASTFFLTTGLHGAHVVVGLVVTVYLVVRATRGAYLDDSRPIEYFGLYWHFVDIVWLFLFPLFYIL